MNPKRYAFWLLVITINIDMLYKLDGGYQICWFIYAEISFYTAMKQGQKR